MKKKEDIANIIKQKLEGMHPETSAPNWDAVMNTLDRRKRFRQGMWLLGSVLSIALIALFIQNFATDSSINQSENGTQVQAASNAPNSEDGGINDNANSTTANEFFASDDEQLVSDAKAKELQNDKAKNNNESNTPIKQVSVTEFDSVDPMQGAQVKTTYYYYRDSDKTEVITKNKKVLDSLLERSASRISKDSI